MNGSNIDSQLGQIMAASNDAEVTPPIKEIVSALGAHWYVFVSLHPVDRTTNRATHRFLIGCRPEWCQIYNARKWYLIDPCIEYARTNTAPILGSNVPLMTQGQQDCMAAAAEYGFRSGFVVPAHGTENGRIGVLYVGSEDPADTTAPIFSANRSAYRVLAAELLDWSTARLKRDVIKSLDITDRELTIVRYLRSGFTAADIARELNLSVPTIHSCFSKLKSKIGVQHISAAVKFADQHGLLS